MLLISAPQLEAKCSVPEGDAERMQYVGLIKIKVGKMSDPQFSQFEAECNALLDRIMRFRPPEVKYRLAIVHKTQQKPYLLCY